MRRRKRLSNRQEKTRLASRLRLDAAACPLDRADVELVEVARAVMRQHYRPLWHTVAAALRDANGRIWTGLHLGATVGRLQICAEAIALGRAKLEGAADIETVVAVRHPKQDEPDQDIAVVSPCGACREMFADFAPSTMVIVTGEQGLIKVPLALLLPLPYRR
ncbi:cytidine deaminase [Granulibacter bethesdensis]|uniref:cytidine deaminase n=1 Tax=Granulibacter bethesdensis TaxID=364410 RepID=UPI002FC94F1B